MERFSSSFEADICHALAAVIRSLTPIASPAELVTLIRLGVVTVVEVGTSVQVSAGNLASVTVALVAVDVGVVGVVVAAPDPVNSCHVLPSNHQDKAIALVPCV